MQVNAYSIVEERDPVIRRNARLLLERDQVEFLGTDAHTISHRPPNALSALRYLQAQLPPQRFDALTQGNARRLLLEND